MAHTVQLKRSLTASSTPSAGQLAAGELAINTVDETIFFKNSGGTVKSLSAMSDLTSNLVTLATTQTISGAKTFSGNAVFSGSLSANGAVTFNNAFTFPTADGTNGQALVTNGSGTVSWGSVSASPAGSDTQVQFNDGGSFGGDAGLTYNKTTDTLTLGSLVSTSGISVNGVIVFTFEGITADDYETQMLVAEPTQDNFIYFPNSSGYVALVPGSNTQVMFNDGGTTLGGDSGFTYNKSTDTLTLGGDIAVNGGDLTTTAGTASVFNTNATTLNIGQAATQINLGAASGDVDIAGGLQTVDEIVAGTVLGVNKTDPAYAADINAAAGNCLRLIYNSSSGSPTNYVNFAVSSSGDLTLTPSGGDVSMNANMGMNDKVLSSVELLAYYERYQLASLSKGGGLTIDLSLGQVITSNLEGNITSITISNIPDNGNANAVGFTLILVADGTARTVTWPVNFKWENGTAPTLTSTNGKADIFSFVSINAGTNWYAFIGGQNF